MDLVITIAGNNERGFNDGTGLEARFNRPAGLAVDSVGNIFVADSGNHCIRLITPDGNVCTYAGNPNSQRPLANPCGITFDLQGNLFVTDTYNLITKITKDGEISCIVNDQSLKRPAGICVDFVGDIYVAGTRFLCFLNQIDESQH